MNKRTIIVVIAIIAVILVLASVILIIVVGKNNNKAENKNNEQNIQNVNPPTVNEETNNTQNNETGEHNQSKTNILIVVFSRAGENYAVGNVEVGNTQVMANYIKDVTNGDMFVIEPVVPYPQSYDETRAIAQKEKDNNERPQIKNIIENINQYDTIFIGYPIWLGTYPMIINTFFESYDLTGKTIVPFNTHEGSGSSGTFDLIKQKLPTATVKDGLSIAGSTIRNSRETVEKWVRNTLYKINILEQN